MSKAARTLGLRFVIIKQVSQQYIGMDRVICLFELTFGIHSPWRPHWALESHINGSTYR